MRILHVIMGLDVTVGGPAFGLANLVRAQARRGHEVHVLACTDSDGVKVLPPGQADGLHVHQAPIRSRLLWRDRRLDALLADLVGRVDLVHIHGTWRYHSIAAAAEARRRGVPYILRPAGNLGCVSFAIRRWRKLPWFYLLEKPAADHAAGIHCCSRKEDEEIHRLGLKAPRFIVPMPVAGDLLNVPDDPQLARRTCPGLPDSAAVILYLGRICSIKRLDVLLEAFILLADRRPDDCLVIAGPEEDAALLARLQRRGQAAGVRSRLFFPGMVQGATKAALFRRARLFAQPSAHENFGQSVAEALLFGLPCVLSEGVALADEVDACGAGLRRPSLPDAFAQAIVEQLEDDACWRRASEAARGLAEKFLPDRVCGELESRYLAILKRKVSGS